ncbi:DUF6306 domain-containing protein [Ammoniphilus sp. CFH 90114]|uniref:DUF6306 domain-containing protein n=1 Tax=Ammoniphilus sp. CFH 90114 TaxID=2493665 RepID=UPI00100DD13A|nr:DUF6306 domain-containing protein [Ammoniphilus sp. CFH 90114]RXT07042.1 hypothetical protein EIZ39_12865 [Ammoniphilus sp. CFH 90114]
MRDLIGTCIRCQKDIYCTDGFFNGITLESGNNLCLVCKDQDPFVEILNRLLEAEKSGVAVLDDLLKTYPSSGLEDSFVQVKEDESWSCQGLIHSIQREGGTVSKEIGDFIEKVRALPSLKEKLALLNKGQAWVARKIDEAISYGMDTRTRTFLLEMKKRHEQNIDKMEQHI